MTELPMELKQRVEEAGKDKQWAEKVCSAGSVEKYAELLKEKGIELPEQVKAVLDTNSSLNKTGKLEDNDLENVTGGWTNIFNCPREYNRILCDFTFCPHIKTTNSTPDEDHYDRYCDCGYWTSNLSYPNV